MQYFYVYILKCSDGSYYTGHTDDFEKRMYEHKQGRIKCYTKDRLPVEIVFVENFESREEALIAERKLKGWTRKKKEALIERGWVGLKGIWKEDE